MPSNVCITHGFRGIYVDLIPRAEPSATRLVIHAAQFIQQTGYHRRDAEFAALQPAVADS